MNKYKFRKINYQMVGVRFPDDVMQDIKKIADKEKVTYAEVVRVLTTEAIKDYLKPTKLEDKEG